MSYYTPTIEEFHVGSEYETTNGYEWVKKVFSKEDLKSFLYEQLENCINQEYIRVKYLDREDIESLGGVELPDTNSFDIGECQIYFQDHTFVEVYDDCGRLVFQGAAKNKSELKRVLKQVGVL